LLINSDYSCESVEVKESDYSFLKYNSYICCGSLFQYSKTTVINSDSVGKLLGPTISELIETVPKDDVLPDEHKDIIIEHLNEML